MHDLAVYLRLAPEFGGHRYGPFEGLEVRLGHDRDRCDIVIPEGFGVLSEHVKVVRQDAANLVLTPSDRTAATFLWKAGERRPSPLHTPTAVRPGDAFSLVTPEGPRFTVELDELPPELKAKREEEASRKGTGRRRLSAESMKAEVKRQAWTTILTTGPAQLAQRAVTFVKSGAIFQPRNIIMGIMIVGGWVVAGGTSCKMASLNKELGTSQTRYEDCQKDKKMAEELGNSGAEFKFSDSGKLITGSYKLSRGLEADKTLMERVKKAARTHIEDPAAFDWLLGTKGNPQRRRFKEWHGRVNDANKFDNDMRVLFTWLASSPNQTQEDWATAVDSAGVDVCQRGHLRMTYRQAKNLGVKAALDGWAPGGSASIDTAEARRGLLTNTARAAGETLAEGELTTEDTPVDQGGGVCVNITADDDRDDAKNLAEQLEVALGSDAEGLPADTQDKATIARIAMFWAADMTNAKYDSSKKGVVGVPLLQGVPSAQLEKFESRGEWVIKRTADTIAQAIVVPCLASLSGEQERLKKDVFGEEYTFPNPVNCLVLDWKLRHGE
jgi:hypothetical protein